MKQYFPDDQLINLPEHPIFLGGSIEMWMAEDWQQRAFTQMCLHLDSSRFCALNPRRPNWDSSWEQSKDNQFFRAQVEWELDGLEKAKTVILYLQKETKSPITLLELGLFAASGKLLIVCPHGFWRKWNVDIVAERYNIPQFATLEAAILHIAQTLHEDF